MPCLAHRSVRRSRLALLLPNEAHRPAEAGGAPFIVGNSRRHSPRVTGKLGADCLFNRPETTSTITSPSRRLREV